MKNETKSFLNNLSIAKKTAMLTVIVTIGTLLIGAVAHFAVSGMKKNYNSFYDKRFTTIQTLDKVRQIYTNDIQQIVLNMGNDGLDVDKTADYLRLRKEDALRNWKNFLSLYYNSKDKDDIGQQKIVDALQEHIMIVNKSMQDGLLVLRDEGVEGFHQKSYKQLLKGINLLDIKMSNLVDYNFKLAKKERESISNKFSDVEWIVIIITALVLLLSLYFTFMIAKNFERLLHNMSRIVEKRNRENEAMQKQLEAKVDRAVERARAKDHIMYQHARHASMGEMIGNIAHQWRQPLNALTLLIQSFGTKSLSGKLNQEFIDKQVDEGLRLAVSMSNTIEDFRNFFSPSKEKEHFNLNNAIHDTLDMSSFFCKDEHIDIQVVCDEDITVHGYVNEFSQVILNFINNARDNFKQKQIHNDKKIEVFVEKDDEKVKIYFRDNGGGIEASIIDRIFEPYFTTKHKATGTGIGLYMSKQIIEAQMNGEVSVQNIKKELGGETYRCAEFKIVIPA